MRSNPALTPDEVDEHRGNWLASFRSPATAEAFRYDSEIFLGWLADQGLQLHEVRRADGDRYRVWLETKATRPRTGRDDAVRER